MEKFKRRFSIDAPTPFTTERRKSEPVCFGGKIADIKGAMEIARPGRRYSTSVNSPVSSLHGKAESNTERHNKYSSNKEVSH